MARTSSHFIVDNVCIIDPDASQTNVTFLAGDVTPMKRTSGAAGAVAAGRVAGGGDGASRGAVGAARSPSAKQYALASRNVPQRKRWVGFTAISLPSTSRRLPVFSDGARPLHPPPTPVSFHACMW